MSQRDLSDYPIRAADDDASRRTYRSPLSLDEQREEIRRLRAHAAQTQVDKWRAEATHLLHPRMRFCSLLEEGCRYESMQIGSGRGSRPYIVSDPELLADDIRSSYKCMLRDAHRLFDELEARGTCFEAQYGSANDAVASFSALYPWSDGIGCRDLLVHHRYFAMLASHRLITAGKSGVITMTGFGAAQALAEVKSEASVKARMIRMEMYNPQRLPSSTNSNTVDVVVSPPLVQCAAPTTAVEHQKPLLRLDESAEVEHVQAEGRNLTDYKGSGDSATDDAAIVTGGEGLNDDVGEDDATCCQLVNITNSSNTSGRSKRSSRRHRRGKLTIPH